MTEVAKTGTEEVSQAVDDFLDKWCHGLGCIAEDADVIVSALSATINDFLVTETKVKYDLMMVQRQKQFEEDHPVTSWLEDQGIGDERTVFRDRIDPVDHGQNQGQEQGHPKRCRTSRSSSAGSGSAPRTPSRTGSPANRPNWTS
ncbi:hypothetical protein ACFV7R_14350 [Streptomyces sp. NPDC059866]|uniref:hypothetical protein n=1 Tax=Streptomyces sp. NPDC059866 TaxID=3346978 RepID=UPI0036567C6B